jgi:hypothetical protein
MSDKSGKAKKSKASTEAQPSVLASLPSTRPERLGRRAPAKAAATKPKAAAAKPKAKASKAKAATKRAAASKPRAAVKPAPTPAAAPPPRRTALPRPEDGRRPTPPSGSELVTTAIQAAGELARIGVTVGMQALKQAARRLPRP